MQNNKEFADSKKYKETFLNKQVHNSFLKDLNFKLEFFVFSFLVLPLLLSTIVHITLPELLPYVSLIMWISLTIYGISGIFHVLLINCPLKINIIYRILIFLLIFLFYLLLLSPIFLALYDAIGYNEETREFDRQVTKDCLINMRVTFFIAATMYENSLELINLSSSLKKFLETKLQTEMALQNPLKNSFIKFFYKLDENNKGFYINEPYLNERGWEIYEVKESFLNALAKDLVRETYKETVQNLPQLENTQAENNPGYWGCFKTYLSGIVNAFLGNPPQPRTQDTVTNAAVREAVETRGLFGRCWDGVRNFFGFQPRAPMEENLPINTEIEVLNDVALKALVSTQEKNLYKIEGKIFNNYTTYLTHLYITTEAGYRLAQKTIETGIPIKASTLLDFSEKVDSLSFSNLPYGLKGLQELNTDLNKINQELGRAKELTQDAELKEEIDKILENSKVQHENLKKTYKLLDYLEGQVFAVKKSIFKTLKGFIK